MTRRCLLSCLPCLVACLLLLLGQGGALAARGEWPGRLDVHAVERALAGTGFRVESLLRRHERAGQGGPFVPEAAGDLAPDRADRLNRALRVLPLAAPLVQYEVSSGFGRRRDPVNKRRAMHAGIDLRAPLRAEVMATAPGRVTFAGRRGGYGRIVEIDHGLGVRTRYAHLSRISVRVGQQVVLGARVGLVGTSGRSTGPHLHYEVLVDGRARNPQPFLRAGQRLRVAGN